MSWLAASCFDTIFSFPVRDFRVVIDDFTVAVAGIGTVMYDTRMGVMRAEIPQNTLADEIFQNLMVAFNAIYKCIFFWPFHKSGKTSMWRQFVSTMDYFRKWVTKQANKLTRSICDVTGMLTIAYVFSVSEQLTNECVVKHKRGERGLVDDDVNLPLSILRDPRIRPEEVVDIQTSLLMGGIDTVSPHFPFKTNVPHSRKTNSLFLFSFHRRHIQHFSHCTTLQRIRPNRKFSSTKSLVSIPTGILSPLSTLATPSTCTLLWRRTCDLTLSFRSWRDFLQTTSSFEDTRSLQGWGRRPY